MTGTNSNKDINDLYKELDIAKVEYGEVAKLQGTMKKTGRNVLISVAIVFAISLLAGVGFAAGLSGLLLVVSVVLVPILNLGMSGAVEMADSKQKKIEAEVNRELLR